MVGDLDALAGSKREIGAAQLSDQKDRAIPVGPLERRGDQIDDEAADRRRHAQRLSCLARQAA